MGQRANYVLTTGGKFELYYSHWGAMSIVSDMIWGPEAGIHTVKQQRRVDTWLDNVWCEGAVLLDLDNQVMLWFSDHEECCDVLEQKAATDLLKAAWPGWDVRWAPFGLGSFTDYLQLPRSLVTTVREYEAPADWASRQPLDLVETIVSVQQEERSVVFAADHDVDELLGRKLKLLTDPVPWDDFIHLDDPPSAGIHIDPKQRVMYVWSVASLGWLPELGDGWRIEYVTDNLAGHQRYADIRFEWPPPSLAFQQLLTIVTPRDTAPISTMVDQLVSEATQYEGVVEINPFIHDYSPASPPENQQSYLRSLAAKVGVGEF